MPLTHFDSGITSFGVPVLPPGGGGPNGNVFFVDSEAAFNGDLAGYGTVDHPFASIDFAVGRCTANNGDVIHVLPGHTETVSAAAGLDLDVAGITIVFHGNDNDRARINFTTVVGADMDVDAADVTLVNPRFTAGIDALTGPIDVNAARFKMINALYEDGASIDTTDCVVADANADDLVIDGFEYRVGDEGGTQKQSLIQVAAATRPIIKNVHATGDFATGIIENGTAWIDALLENLVLDNANTTPTVCVLLQSTSTGWLRNSSLRVASGNTGVTASSNMQSDNVNTIGADAGSVSSSASRIVSHAKADVTAGTAWTTANSPVSVFTVTGDVLARAYAVVTTNMTSVSNTGTLELGVTANTAGLLVQDQVDATAFQAGDVWTLTTGADTGGATIADEWFFIGNGADIILTVATNNMSAGGVTIYVEYIPVSAGATVVSAGGEA